MDHYDVIIIGTGAGGGTLAHRLAPSGKRILLLERGDYVPREKENWDTKAVVLEGRYGAKEEWRDKDGKKFHPHTNYYVGGNTKFYGAALFRLRERDFGELRHHGGISPAWPISYADLEPHYSEAERLYQVHGERGCDPTEPPAAAPYAYPPQQLADDLRRVGLRPFHVPLGVMLDERNPRTSRCIRCNTCDGHPCLIYAKSDAQVVCVDPALAYPNVTLLTNAYVARLDTGPSGRAVTSVQVRRDGATETYSANIVVVSCGAINSAALLLRSANDGHPQGLANGSGVVGRHYMSHINSVYLALSKCANPTRFQKTLAVNDFYFGSKEWPYPMGHISFVGKTDGHVLAAGAPALRSRDLRTRSRLQSARARQPVRGGRQLLPLERRREPGPDHHGQRAAGRRPHPGALAVKLARLAVLALALGAAALPAQQPRANQGTALAGRTAAVAAVGPVALTVSDMDRSLAFYTGVLDFRKIADTVVDEDSYGRLEGVPGSRMRIVPHGLAPPDGSLRSCRRPQQRSLVPARRDHRARHGQRLRGVAGARRGAGVAGAAAPARLEPQCRRHPRVLLP